MTSCEDVIPIKLDEGTPQLAVDAWITNKAGSQTIHLTKTANYFNNVASPAATGATVKITDDNGQVFSFVDNNNNGYYIWTPGAFDTLARIGHTYTLDIDLGVEHYTSQSLMNPSVKVDSVTYKYDVVGLGKDSAYQAEFWAFDNYGREDYYWIRSIKNGTFNNKPAQLTVAWEAAFGGGDGFLFIPPYRQSINDNDAPFQKGDLAGVEIYSISKNAYDFLSIAQQQMVNGGLFATPPTNVPTNISNTNATTTAQKPVGWFEVSGVGFNQVLIK